MVVQLNYNYLRILMAIVATNTFNVALAIYRYASPSIHSEISTSILVTVLIMAFVMSISLRVHVPI